MSRIAVYGDRESVYGFASLGLDAVYMDKDNASDQFKKLCQSSGYAIIYITEQAAALLDREVERMKELSTPAVILIPGVSGNTGEGLSALRSSVERAVGSDILGD